MANHQSIFYDTYHLQDNQRLIAARHNGKTGAFDTQIFETISF
jgi:hypothetical protein